MRHRIIASLVAMAAAASLTLATPASPANASEPSIAATCYGGAVSRTDILDVKRGPFFTSNRCGDINLRLTAARFQTDARSCLERVVNGVVQTISCSPWKLLPFAWTTLSTNVLDGTRFRVELRGNNGEKVSYQLAF